MTRSRSPLRLACLEALTVWESGEGFADSIIDDVATRRGLAGRDRAFLNALVLGVLRNRSLIDHWIDTFRKGTLRPRVRRILRLGFYQVCFMRVPDHAAVDESVNLSNSPTEKNLVNAILRRGVRERDGLLLQAEDLPLHLRYSLPEFLVSRWTSRFGNAATAMLCRWMNEPAPIYVRENRLHPGAHGAVSGLGQSWHGDSRFREASSLPEGPLAEGHIYVQDPSTALAGDLLAPGTDDRVLDACAAPGGKTALLAEKMGNRGCIVACDSSPARLKVLKQNLHRLGIKNTSIHQIDWLLSGASQISSLGCPPFDCILADVPCSNTGVMRRRVDVRWRLKPGSFTQMAGIQRRILAAVVPLLRPGGRIVYSTCSLELEENEEVVAATLRNHPELKQAETRVATPFQDGTDGAYAALLVKENSG